MKTRPKLYINTNHEKNIWHILQKEIFEIERLISNGIKLDHMLITNFDPNDKRDLWRMNILKYVVHNIYITNDKSLIEYIKILPEQCLYFEPVLLQSNIWYNCWEDYHYPVSQNMISFFEILKVKMNIDCNLNHIKIINRRDSRQVLDINTLEPIEKTFNIQCAYFEDLSFQEQVDFVKDAKVLIAPHGAGLTNLIFTHPNCLICEISLRKYWFCNPICSLHKNNLIHYSNNCNSNIPYSKYDFKNICRLLNRNYIEIINDGFIPNTNASSLLDHKILLNPNKLVKLIHNQT